MNLTALANIKLRQCPCGQTPTDIAVMGRAYDKYALAMPDCCEEWMIEFRTVAYRLESTDTKNAAIEAWNDAPRETRNWSHDSKQASLPAKCGE